MELLSLSGLDKFDQCQYGSVEVVSTLITFTAIMRLLPLMGTYTMDGQAIKIDLRAHSEPLVVLLK